MSGCPSCERDLSWPRQPGHECYTHAEHRERMAHESHRTAPLAAERTTTGPGGRTTIWRVAWRERQDGALAIEREAWVDDEDEGIALADRLVRARRVLGEVLVYDIEIQGAA